MHRDTYSTIPRDANDAQIYPEIPIDAQRYPETPIDTLRYPETPIDITGNREILQDAQRHPEMPRDTHTHTLVDTRRNSEIARDARHAQRYPKTMRYPDAPKDTHAPHKRYGIPIDTQKRPGGTQRQGYAWIP